MMASQLDGNIVVLSEGHKLTWMPAHQTVSMVGEVMKSNGEKLTMRDWRANRLVDLLAKQAAQPRALPKNEVALLDSAKVAVCEAAKLLGRVTHAANHHVVTKMVDGKEVRTIERDAMPAPKKEAKRKTESDPHKVLPMKVAKVAPAVKPWSEQNEPKPRLRTPESLHMQRVNEYTSNCTKRRVDEIGQSLEPGITYISGKSRLEALRRRVQDRIAHEISTSSSALSQGNPASSSLSSVMHDPG
jgi:hypothetical protein